MSRSRPQSMRLDDPLIREAANIAQELDRGDPRLALQRLQEDLQRLQNYPEAQIRLTSNVFRFERKGEGVDLEARKVSRDGYLFADIRATPGHYHGPRNSSPSFSLGMLFLGEDRHQRNNYYERRGDRHGHGHGHGHGHEDEHDHRHNRRSSGFGRGDHPGYSYRGLTPEATAALMDAQRLANQYGIKIEVTSAGRSIEEQARLYRQLKGVRPVAYPGTSSHNFGEAIDVKNYAQAKPFLQAVGFVHGDGKGPIKNDPWHFRYLG